MGNNKIDSLNVDIQKYLNIIKNQEETIKKIESDSKYRVATTNVSRESGFLYFIDKDGDVARAPMARGRK
jgi:hypothetical protein